MDDIDDNPTTCRLCPAIYFHRSTAGKSLIFHPTPVQSSRAKTDTELSATFRGKLQPEHRPLLVMRQCRLFKIVTKCHDIDVSLTALSAY